METRLCDESRASCRAAARPLRMWFLLLVASLSSLAMGAVIIKFIINNIILLEAYLLIVGMGVALSLTVFYRRSSRKANVIRVLCRFCRSEPVYSASRFTYECRGSRGLLLCYDSVGDLIHVIRINKVEWRDDIPFAGSIDYYCLKPIKIINKYNIDGIKIISGRFILYNLIDGVLERVEADAAFIPAERYEYSELESLIRRAIEALGVGG